MPHSIPRGPVAVQTSLTLVLTITGDKVVAINTRDDIIPFSIVTAAMLEVCYAAAVCKVVNLRVLANCCVRN